MSETTEISPARIVAIGQGYLQRSTMARAPRRPKNKANWEAYMCEQDFSHKASFQSRETTPTFPIAIDQIVGTFERALTDSTDWLAVSAPGIGEPLLPPDVIADLTQYYMARIWRPGNHEETAYGVQALVGDACKRGTLEPIIAAKIYPIFINRRHYKLESTKPVPGAPEAMRADELVKARTVAKPVEVKTLRLAVELLDWDSYYPDPSPACRFEIHRTRRAIHELLANEDYDPDVVRSLLSKANAEAERQDYARSKGETSVGPNPYEVDVYEAWGDIIDERSGELLFENVVWTWACSELLRWPTPNPAADGTRPFVTSAILRVPNSTEHKALADHAVPMWRASNELVNLLLDGAFRAAWGVGQARPDLMESPEEIADGVPQGYTAVLKPNVPLGAKFYERVDNGEAPQLSLDQLNRLETYVQQALAIPDAKLGQISDRAVKATEVVQAMQGSGSLYDSFAARFETTWLEPVFQKAWKTIVQYADDFVEEELVSILGARRALILTDMSDAERWKLLHKATFTCRGIRGVAAREREFNKVMTIVNLLGANPQFAEHFGRKYSFDKLWSIVLRLSGQNPAALELDEEPTPPASEELVPGAAGTGESAIAAADQAGGQLDMSLVGSGASQPNISGTVADQRGGESALAPNNPNAQGMGV